ncbi:MAG: tyrosine-type recombinase/integrase [Planctomycetes bacterium]|nr:tyrosine-type recombinase/integrase [Planctomycetota bacterium]
MNAIERVTGEAVEVGGAGRDLVGAFVGAKRSRETRAAYLADLRALAAHLGGREALGTATVAGIVAWRDDMLARGLSPATVGRRLSAARTFYGFAVAEGLRPSNPALHVEGPAVEAARARAPWVEAPDARRILEVPDTSTVRGLRDRAILGLLFRLGLRRGEVAGLTRGQVRQEADGLRLVVHGKGGKTRELVLNGEGRILLSWVERAGLLDAPADALMFASPRNPARALSGRQLANIVRDAARAAGVEVQGGDSLSPHGARRTFATRALDTGATMEALRRAMGHASVATTSRYDRRADADLVVSY